MRVGNWVILIALIVPSLVYAFPQVSPQNDLAAAAAAEREHNYSEAARHYLEFLAISPNPAPAAEVVEVRVRLAIDQFMAHRYSDSLKALAPLMGNQSDRTGSHLPAQAWIVAGLDELELNRLDHAIADLHQGLRSDPASGTARLALGDALARSGHLDQAVREYREQAKRTPKVVEVWYKIGMAETLLAKITRRQFERADPRNPVVRLLAARDSLSRGDGLGAANILLPPAGHGAAVPPARPDAPLPGVHSLLGQAMLDEGSIAAARHEFQKELANNPQSAPAWLGLAEVDTIDARWTAARSRILQLAVLDPHFLAVRLRQPPPAPLHSAWKSGHLHMPEGMSKTSEGRLWLSWIKSGGISGVDIESKRHSVCSVLPTRLATTPGLWLTEACTRRLARELESRHSLSSRQAAKLGESEYRLGNFEKAGAAARRAASDRSATSQASAWGTYWLIRSDEALSLAAIDQAASLDPKAPRVRQLLAQNYANHYEWTKAIQEYQAALRLAPDLAGLHFGLGTAYWQAGNWTQAQPQLEQTLQITPESTVAAYELGDTDINLRQWEKAVPYLKKALANPNVARKARLDLARAESELGHYQEALQNLLPLEKDDSDGKVHFRIGMLYQKLGEKAKARRALAESQKLHLAQDALTTKRMKMLEQERAHLQQAEKRAGQ